EEQHVGGCPGAAHRRKPDPHHRHALGFEHSDQFLDLLGVEFDPAFIAEFIEAVRRARLLGRGGRRRVVVGLVLRRLGIDRFVVGLGGLWRLAGLASLRGGLAPGGRFTFGVFFFVFLLGFFIRFFGRRLPDRDAVV